jgi:protein ImuB
MPSRRFLSLWFPHLLAERYVRTEPHLAQAPFAVVADLRNTLTLVDLSDPAARIGLRRGIGLGDARAICPDLVTRPADPLAEAAFLAALRRWAGRFSPWVAEDPPDGLTLDITGCARLFGDEAGMAAAVGDAAADLGLGSRLGLADTIGAAWAVARYGGGRPGTPAEMLPAGDAIDQEARATRARARKRRWERGGAPPAPVASGATGGDGSPILPTRILPPGETRARLGPLPVAALRLSAAAVEALAGLGLRRIEDLAALPRAQLARRLGPEVVTRLDQALGRAAEPLSPVPPEQALSLRLTLPEPIARTEDVLAGLDRLLAPLCDRLIAAGRGARRVRFELIRTDGSRHRVEVGLARACAEPALIRHLLSLRLDGVDAGFGFEVLRLAAVESEPTRPYQHRGRFAAGADAAGARGGTGPGNGARTGPRTGRGTTADTGPDAAGNPAVADLISCLGARVGIDKIVRFQPVDTHIPEKSRRIVPAAFSAPVAGWPEESAPRPDRMFPPERLHPAPGALDDPRPPRAFRWRRRDLTRTAAFGPERIAPEWWTDDPAWRSGPRDYWRVETADGRRLWLFRTLGAETGGWFVQGIFP